MGRSLGYSTREYSRDEVRTAGSGALCVSVDITNTGARESRELCRSTSNRLKQANPVRLVGWNASTGPPGDTRTVTVETDPRMWRRWNPSENRWGALVSGGRLLIARGLGDIRAALELS